MVSHNSIVLLSPASPLVQSKWLCTQKSHIGGSWRDAEFRSTDLEGGRTWCCGCVSCRGVDPSAICCSGTVCHPDRVAFPLFFLLLVFSLS
ncbi:hypothetical protein LY76DRAFT_119968 [Colletotrichum caudatum]|nr:hypothetical protein LY76DRAFT_119968 [Colletotrichum caudatum]